MQFNYSTLWAAKLLFLAGVATVSLTTNSSAQSCCNGGSMGMQWGEPAMLAEGVDPAAELIESFDPSKVINLTVVVPEKALVKVNGEPTFTKGTVRQYVVRGVEPGKKYKFVIEAEYVNEFQAVYKATKTLTLDAGGSDRVALPLRRVKRPDPPKDDAPKAAPALAT